MDLDKKKVTPPGILALFAVLLVLAFPAILRADDEGGPELGLARISYIQGDTLFNSVDMDDWASLTTNYTLMEGDRLWAGDDSKMELRFSGGAGAWLNYQSELDISRLAGDGGGQTIQLALVAGEASFSVRSFKAAGSVFQVDTPNASVRAYGTARFRVTTLSDGTMQVGVSKGSVEVETPEGVTVVGREEMMEVAENGGSSMTTLPPKDEWDFWVLSRDGAYERPARSSRYLPPAMRDYSYEFDRGGRWVNDPDYGSVWTPVSVTPDWSPYSNGRWVWISGDYVWLPYDPWYAPFHYGRWRWSGSIGWCWIPPAPQEVFWSPGYVGWVWSPTSVYWVPLAPRETYYGYGYHGHDSFDIRHKKIVNVTNIYVNSTVKNGVVVVDRDRFVRGDHTRDRHVERRDNPFEHKGVGGTKLIGRPPVDEIKPTRETRRPNPKARPTPNALPPDIIRKTTPFVDKRPVARDRDKSVFRPGERPETIRPPERKSPPERPRRGKGVILAPDGASIGRPGIEPGAGTGGVEERRPGWREKGGPPGRPQRERPQRDRPQVERPQREQPQVEQPQPAPAERRGKGRQERPAPPAEVTPQIEPAPAPGVKARDKRTPQPEKEQKPGKKAKPKKEVPQEGQPEGQPEEQPSGQRGGR